MAPEIEQVLGVGLVLPPVVTPRFGDRKLGSQEAVQSTHVWGR